MKKYLIAFLALSPVLCFGDRFIKSVAIYKFSAASSPSMSTSTQGINLFESSPFIDDLVFATTFLREIGFSTSSSTTLIPLFLSNSQGLNVSRPFNVSNDTALVYTGWAVAPNTYKFYRLLADLYLTGYRGYTAVYTSGNNVYLNFIPSQVVADVLAGTNTLWRSSVLSALSDINNNIKNIRVDLGQFQTDYHSVNWDSLNFIDFVDGAISNGSFDSSHGQYLKDTYNSFVSAGDLSSAGAFKSSVLQQFRNDNFMSDAATWLNNNANNPTVQNGLRSAGDSFGAGAAFHYTTPLTNEMRRMSADWVNETKAALSNNTQKIKDDLAAWKNDLHGTQTSIDNSTANINNTLNNIAGGSSVVRVNIQNQDIGVTITDPVTIDPTQFNAFSEDLGKAGDYIERLFNEFKWWAWDSPDSWKKGFLDRDLSRLSSNVQDQVSIQHSISNLLADFAINYTNNAQFAISNALAGFSFSSTNDYLLLSDYHTFIDSSKYNSVVSSLPDDLASALSSFGFSDSSEYSGRWWVFQSANMALQSQLALTNAALSSTLLNALSAIDDSDDSGGSLLSRWLSLIDSIPDPEEIQQSLADATNIVSNIGFERVDALYATATQDLISVVKGIYRDKSLPDNIRFVFIPAADGRDEKYVDIPVGEHSSLWSLFRSGMAFALSVVTLLLFPKYVSWLVSHYTRLVERIIKSLHAYTHQ